MTTLSLSRRALCIAAAFGPAASFAQPAYPDKPVKLVVPWAPGGPVDAVARAIAAGVGPRLGQPLIVENKPGASGTIGATLAASSAPDGYTIFVANVDTHVVNPLVIKNVRYKPVEGFDPIVEVGRLPMVIAVRTGLAARNVPELVKLAQSRPGGLSYGSWGQASVGHIALAMLEQQAGVQMVHVPYLGAAPALAALLGGQIDMMIAQGSWAEQQAKAGKVQIIGMTSTRRSALYPAIPTVAEQGYPGYAAEQWVSLFVPKGVPAPVRARLNKEINAWLATDKAQALLKDIGLEPTGGTPEQLAEHQKKEMALWGAVVKARSITSALE